MRSAFNLFVFHNSMFTQFLMCKGYVLSGEVALKNNHYYYDVYILSFFIKIVFQLFCVCLL